MSLENEIKKLNETLGVLIDKLDQLNPPGEKAEEAPADVRSVEKKRKVLTDEEKDKIKADKKEADKAKKEKEDAAEAIAVKYQKLQKKVSGLVDLYKSKDVVFQLYAEFGCQHGKQLKVEDYDAVLARADELIAAKNEENKNED